MITQMQLEDIAEEKGELFAKWLKMEPPTHNGEALLKMWDEIYTEDIRNTVVKTATGPSDDETNPVFPYEKLQAVFGPPNAPGLQQSDKDFREHQPWKYNRLWQNLDEYERRGPAYREGEKYNFGQPNKNPNIWPMRVLIVGGGPVGLRLAIELKLSGHKVTIFEKRREKRSETGELETLGFTNRINRPHMWNFVRNDLDKLNGRLLMSPQTAAPVFAAVETSSIGIDELQVLLLKNALLLGVDFRLGVGYNDAKPKTDSQTMQPFWEVDCTYDTDAADKFGKAPGKNKEVFDCLVGCDGPRSAVRDTQAKHFGKVEKRKFSECVGVVANLRKVNRKRLKELGFDFGQEPQDMSRMIPAFQTWVDDINEKCDSEIEGIIYYKAAFHNYCILVPKKRNLVKHGLPDKVYHHTVARQAAAGRDEEKAKLKAYVCNILQAAGIPLDAEAPNGGFVDAPNDVMAFDFAECWNTSRSMNFNLPPPDYDVDTMGPWQGRQLVPLVALCGDSLLEPFWPMGLGLKRGWQAIMDVCYAIDNLYNPSHTCEMLGKGKDLMQWTWDDHFEALKDQVNTNFEQCKKNEVAKDLFTGKYDEKGAVLMQLLKISKDAEKPTVHIEVDPWTRYKKLADEKKDDWKTVNVADRDKLHPVVKKTLARIDFYDESKNKKGDFIYDSKKPISVGGKVIGGFGKAGTVQKRGSKDLAPAAAPVRSAAAAMASKGAGKGLGAIMAANKAEIEAKSAAAAASFAAGKGPDADEPAGPPTQTPAIAAAKAAAQKRASVAAAVPKTPPVSVAAAVPKMPPAPSPVPAPTLAPAPLAEPTPGVVLSAAKQAELAHVRSMITSLTQSLESYRKAETEILAGRG